MITPDKVYAHLDRIQAWRDGDKPAPVTVEWDLSNRCDRGCQACHMAYTHVRGPLANSHDGPPGSTPTGDLADTDLVLRVLAEMAAAGVQGIVWTGGGEPTLHPGFEPIVSAAARHGLAQGMYTHGGHIDRKRAELIKQHFSWVVISLDRSDADAYRAYKGGGPKGFERACNGVRSLASAEGACTVGVSFLIDADTWQDAERCAAFGLSLGADYVTFRPMIDFDQADPAQPIGDRSWVTAAMPTLEELATRPGIVCDPARFAEYRDWTGRSYHTCYGVRMNTTITPDSRVWLCVNKRGFPGAELGDLKRESFADLWARHPGKVTDFSLCRVMCRLHLVNERLAAIEAPMTHSEFV
jgi:MoaA/NifB/PqqE/SkfB family radical SAM enzyme